MKRIFTGLILGIIVLVFVFYTEDILFEIILYAILAFSIYEIFRNRRQLNIFIWFLLIAILTNIVLVQVINDSFTRAIFFSALIISVLSDVCALVFGKLFGKNFIFPNISPNKTLEGTIFGLFLPGLIILAFSFLFIEKIIPGVEYFHNYFSYLLLINKSGFFTTFLVITICSLISIFGDLIASKSKRIMNIKDFGNLLPGHGGILDRIDSHLFCIPLFLFLTYLIL